MAIQTRWIGSLPLLVVVFALTPTIQADCESNVTVDPDTITRIGSDYKWLKFDSSATIADCISACCAEKECVAFSYNNESKFCTEAENASKCCGLKSIVPQAQTSHFNGSVTTGHKHISPVGIPIPTPQQQAYMDMGFTQFMHFSVTTFGNIEHDCVNGKCLSPELFHPTEMGPDADGLTATDQWAKTAAEMGAGQICLTAHHEGGFCLFDSQYTNYTVMSSGYKHDILPDFIASCRKYGIQPCFYIGPNANGYLTQVLNNTPAEFYKAQMGMIREVLTNYGTDVVSRLWWDHYMRGCGGLSECPACTDDNDPTCFPTAWSNFTQLVRELSPSTVIGTGPDVGHSGGGETGVGDYPVWNAVNDTQHSPYGPFGYIFKPREADATIQNPGDAWFWKENHSIWNASQLWDHYMLTVGRGENFILNMPPDTTGRIPREYAEETRKLGQALKAFENPVAKVASKHIQCGKASVEVPIPADAQVNAVMAREDLSRGQAVAKYQLSFMDSNGVWNPLTISNGQTVGNKVIDLLSTPLTDAQYIRFDCMESVRPDVYIRDFAAFYVVPPA
eukprot:TRINITY_DN10611_c0_g1_i4.p1 TRINITY_DN10611_c0_g1~~TRINITY_DN10611_c0_g1_i4.p1  ORF type:complete len:572 (+),score=87.06 TRINITY_DN10611_c0_g1_i4:28-1716(+)